jgi:hypothetical protein
MPDPINSELAFSARFVAAWPVWAGGYPTPAEALERTTGLRETLLRSIQEFLNSKPALLLIVHDLQVRQGEFEPIKGLSPRAPAANSQEVSLTVHTRLPATESRTLLSNALPEIVEKLSPVVRNFFRTQMPGAPQGANLYDVQHSWEPAPNIPIRDAKVKNAKAPRETGMWVPKSARVPKVRPSDSVPAIRPMNPSFVTSLKSGRPAPYVILRPRLLNQTLHFEYEDSSGEKRLPQNSDQLYLVSPVGTPGWLYAPQVWAPADLDSLLGGLTAHYGKVGFGHDEPEVLPVFVASDPLLPNVPFDLLAERLPPIVGRWNQIQVVRLARETWQRRAPFQLPLRIAPRTEALDRALDVMRGRTWYLSESAVQEFGLKISAAPPPGEPGSLDQDLLVSSTSGLRGLLGTIARMKLEDRPRIVIAIGEGPQTPAPVLPDGLSVLIIPSNLKPSEVGEFVKEFLYGIIHDLSLPTALKGATLQAGSQLTATPCLIADPLSVQDLRLKDALIAVLHEALDLHTAPSLDPALSTWYSGAMVNYAVAPAESIVQTSLSSSTINQVLKLPGNFTRESSGLVPIAQARGSLRKAQNASEELQNELALLARDPDVRKVFAEHQERQVDITLLRDEPNYDLSLFVQQGEKIQSGADFLLRVQIGRRSPASLLVGEVPSIDPILPTIDPTDGHHLHCVLFAQDFVSRSPQMCRMFLPQFGNSEAAVFAITAPELEGLARLRVGVYYDLPGESSSSDSSRYHNHLLQMFLLEATVGDTAVELGDGDVGLSVKLEFSRTTRFSNLDGLSERRISIAINDDPKGSHRLLIKGGESYQDILWSESAGDNALKSMRGLLEKVTWDDSKKGPRFPENPIQKPEAEFDRWIQELVLAGGALHDDLWTQVSADFQDVLRKLRDSSEKVIQVTRLATNFLFPWASLYDFDRPSTKPGAAPVEVCKEFTRPGYSCEKCLEDCRYPDKSKTYCVYGFWGTRHKVEQLLHTPFQREDAILEIKPAAQKAVQISVGVTGQIVDQFIPTLQSTLGQDSVHDLQSLDEMIKRLWSDGDRPAILLVLGHYETSSSNQPRITFAGKEWFEPADITKQVKKLARWKDSNPLVVLAACESGAASLASITSFLTAFADARAAAVIGTETTVFEGLACRFAKEISVAMMEPPSAEPGAKKQCLGDAVLSFRRGLLQDFNPLGLVFTPYGDADLHRT